MKRKLIILGLGFLLIGLTFATFPVNLASATDPPFSVIWITDTQFLSASSPGDFDSLCTWIVNNSARLNLKAVIHTGDLVDTDTDANQWSNAAHSMGLLLSNNITYCWCAGNHDTFVSQSYPAFNVSAMRLKPYWVSDYNGGMDTAISFNISNQKILLIDIEYDGDNSVLQWANNLINNNPSASVIIGTHEYLDPSSGGYSSWATNFQVSVLNTHPKVFMTLNGHFHPTDITAYRTRVGSRDELYWDRQDADSYRGAGAARIFTFDVAQNKVNVTTYNTNQNYYMTDSDNQFTLQPSVPIPEFAAFLILPFLMIAMTLAASLLRREPKR